MYLSINGPSKGKLHIYLHLCILYITGRPIKALAYYHIWYIYYIVLV